MNTVTMKGSPLELSGTALQVGGKIPDFQLTANDMSDISASQFLGKKLILVVVPSLDTPVCSLETTKFNHAASELPNIQILIVSRDLPFAQKRWCGAEGVESLMTASDYKYRTFGEQTGTLITTLQLLARAVFVVGTKGTIEYVEYVKEIGDEPNYEAALQVAKK